MTTAELGQLMVLQKLTSLGASNAIVQKEGNRSSITFDAPNGKTYKVTTRAKTSGTWQTTTNYAELGTSIFRPARTDCHCPAAV